MSELYTNPLIELATSSGVNEFEVLPSIVFFVNNSKAALVVVVIVIDVHFAILFAANAVLVINLLI